MKEDSYLQEERESRDLSLNLDITVLDIRDQSEHFAWTDQYPEVEILTRASRFKYENLAYEKNKRYEELTNNLTFKIPSQCSPDERVSEYMKGVNIFTKKADYFNLRYSEEQSTSPILPIVFLLMMGILGLIIALRRRKQNAY